MPSEAGQEFGDPAAYPYMTVASPSCHDTSTTRAWWEQDVGRRERFYDQARLSDGAGPADLRVKWWCYGR
jgi:4-alpha-glucanotransferase